MIHALVFAMDGATTAISLRILARRWNSLIKRGTLPRINRGILAAKPDRKTLCPDLGTIIRTEAQYRQVAVRQRHMAAEDLSGAKTPAGRNHLRTLQVRTRGARWPWSTNTPIGAEPPLLCPPYNRGIGLPIRVHAAALT